MEALARVLVDMLCLGFAHIDPGMRLAHKVVLALVAQLFKHDLLVFDKLARLMLQSGGASRASATVEDRIGRVQLSAVLLDAALIDGSALLIIAPHLLLLQLLLLKDREILLVNHWCPITIHIDLPIALYMGTMGRMVLGSILLGRRSGNLVVARAFLLFDQLLARTFDLVLTCVWVLVSILCLRVAWHLLKRLAAVMHPIKVNSVHTVW